MASQNFVTRPGSQFVQSGTGAVERTVESKLQDVVNVKDFGAKGDNSTNDTAAIQAAIDSLANGGVLYFPPGAYRIARTVGTNDRWGLKVTQSNITLQGDQASLRRFNTDISTYALAYPILFVGTPDSDVAAATENFTVEGITFIGEDIRHSISGSSPTDFRYAIEFKNTRGTLVDSCKFTKIDSQAINYQYPVSYNYVTSTYFNKTKNYQSKVTNCSFIAESHLTVDRALIHAISVTGVDDFVADSNYFEWCDDCISGSATYNNYSDKETDTYTNSNAPALGAVKRTGRRHVISNNTCYNSSEHVFYMESMDVAITGNTIHVDDSSVCTGDIKIRSRGASVVGNRLSNVNTGIGLNEACSDVSVVGNAINVNPRAGYTGGAISVDTAGIKTYIDNRPWYYVGGNPDYKPCQNLLIDGNTINFPESAAANSQEHVALRIFTDLPNTTDFPNGFVRAVIFNNNTISNYNVGIFNHYGTEAVNDLQVSNNTFIAKPFTTSGFSAGTTLNTRSVLQSYQSGAGATTTALRNVTFTGNRVYGSIYLWATHTGSGSASTYYLPEQINNNRLDYIKNLGTADMRPLLFDNKFVNNVGVEFLDRTWSGLNIGNSLRVSGATHPAQRFNFQWVNNGLRFYTDDSNSFVEAALLSAAQTFTATQTFQQIWLRQSSDRVEAFIRNQATAVSVGNTATTIVTFAPDVGGLLIVSGSDTAGNNRFCDLVMASTTANPSVLTSFTSWGTPAARTYTRSGGALQLSMASSTYNVKALKISE